MHTVIQQEDFMEKKAFSSTALKVSLPADVRKMLSSSMENASLANIATPPTVQDPEMLKDRISTVPA
jgi:hypothetical protein